MLKYYCNEDVFLMQVIIKSKHWAPHHIQPYLGSLGVEADYYITVSSCSNLDSSTNWVLVLFQVMVTEAVQGSDSSVYDITLAEA